MLIDTHCHIHDKYKLDAEVVLRDAHLQAVKKIICIGTDAESSARAVAFANSHEGVFATIGLHPSEVDTLEQLETIRQYVDDPSVVAIGECGLDYYYDQYPRATQKALLHAQFEFACEHDLPMVFHLRASKEQPEDAFNDFWEIYDLFKPAGVIHSFSSTSVVAEAAIKRGLYFGLNGIITFMQEEQLSVIRRLPLDSIVLETDAPLLTPVPFRGTINEPKHIRVIAEFISQLRGEPAKQIAARTSNNAVRLFKI